MIGNPTRPGDLAIVIYPPGFEGARHDHYRSRNVGAMVRVVSGECEWRGINPLQPLTGIDPVTGQDRPVYPGEIVDMHDQFLKPIRPADPIALGCEPEAIPQPQKTEAIPA